MVRMFAAAFAALLLITSTAIAQDEVIKSAMSAGPESISADATILDWEMNVVREGTNEWTCLPDRPNTEGTDPWCITGPWMNFLQAYVTQTEPDYDELGIAYMLMGDAPVSNSDPYATEPTGPEDWVTDMGAHIMLIVPDHSMLKGLSTDHRNGGPWVMWPDTPYAHVMVPVENRWPKAKEGY
ncbi:MAG: hypothetical protein KJO06_03175 [Gemmatimonadetes bacterium]|nr:hypothetical protein [Gemmatimonadota bacterium]NNK49641.1 hypothetical protein [Gemmatimonadota bacterium]